MIGYAHALRVEALAGLGDLIKKMPKATGARGIGKSESAGPDGTRTQPPTLADQGVDKKTANVARKLAALSDTELRFLRMMAGLYQSLRAASPPGTDESGWVAFDRTWPGAGLGLFVWPNMKSAVGTPAYRVCQDMAGRLGIAEGRVSSEDVDVAESDDALEWLDDGGPVTPQQLWYVSSVYPEPVTPEEAERAFAEHHPEDTERHLSYWESAARVLDKLGRR